MSLGRRDAARLRRIEHQLRRDAPGLDGAFRHWVPPDTQWQDRSDVVPAWVLATMLVGFASWIAGAVAGLIAATAAVIWLYRLRRAARRTAHRPPPQSTQWHHRA